MKFAVRASLLLLAACASSTSGAVPQGDAGANAPDAAPAVHWITGYYYGREAIHYPPSAIDWSALTDIAVAFYAPLPDGQLDATLGQADAAAGAALSAEIVSAAHAHGVRAIASIGGAESAASFRAAASDASRTQLVRSLGALLAQGYDAIDFDWEPLTPSDDATILAVASALRAERPGALLSLAALYTNPNHPTDLAGFAAVANAFDRVNLTTYHMASVLPGWKSWHNAALHAEDRAAPTSVEETVGEYASAGVPPYKMGIGVPFYGLCFTSPVDGPLENLGGAALVDTNMGYATIRASYFSADARRWDPVARVPYLSFATPHGPDKCTFVSYDDEQSIAEKAAFLRDKHLGGAILWPLNRDVRPDNPLLSAVKANFPR